MGGPIRRAAMSALAARGARRGELSIALVGRTEMKRLHAKWLGEDSVTDVITFDLRESMRRPRKRNGSAQGSITVDGQIVICTAVAMSEARRRRIPGKEELLRYVVHGCLHLCGYDDRRLADALRMQREQERLLREVLALKARDSC